MKMVLFAHSESMDTLHGLCLTSSEYSGRLHPPKGVLAAKHYSVLAPVGLRIALSAQLNPLLN